ncbi:Chromo domain protein LHP1 [Leucoagaricus sp. SymC.cos]|nr:Chromo domain protein LHP1 [Leucoagaricus sp. SymC.cos]
MKKTSHLRLPTFEIGQKVWLNNKNLPLYRKYRKLMPKREGPFEIIDKKSPVVFKLRLPPQWKIHDTFHASLLVPHTENFLYGQHHERPPPELEEGEETYEVEAIVNHKLIRNRFHYFVKWEGYPTSENTWEPPENLEKATDVLRRYKRLHRLP